MANAHAFYQNSFGEELHFNLDIDLKTQSIHSLFVKGSLKEKYAGEIEHFKQLVEGLSLSKISLLKRSDLTNEVVLENHKKAISSLCLWLFFRAIEDYFGSDTIAEQKDLLCLCFGVSKNDIKKKILKDKSYDLSKLIAETKATSACGSCLSSVQKSFETLRSEHGLIFGLDHSQSRFDKFGHWVKINGLYPAELVVKLDGLKTQWMKREGIEEELTLEITQIEGHHLWIQVKSKTREENKDRFEKILMAFGDFIKSEIGVLFFVHLAL